MSDTTRLPRYLIIAELAGGVLVLLSIVLINSHGRLTGGEDSHMLAKISLTAGILLILPAVITLGYRTPRAILARSPAKQ